MDPGIILCGRDGSTTRIPLTLGRVESTLY